MNFIHTCSSLFGWRRAPDTEVLLDGALMGLILDNALSNATQGGGVVMGLEPKIFIFRAHPGPRLEPPVAKKVLDYSGELFCALDFLGYLATTLVQKDAVFFDTEDEGGLLGCWFPPKSRYWIGYLIG